MLDDLRPVLADILNSHGNAWGAESLRYVSGTENPAPRGDELRELEQLREFIDELGEILTYPPAGPRGGKANPATTLKEIAALLARLVSD